jgi:hypothetical protein
MRTTAIRTVVTVMLSACLHVTAMAQQPASGRLAAMNADAAQTRGPVRNLTPVIGQEVVTLRYFKIRKGAFPEFLKASQEGVWPFFEKIGARIVGMWQVVPGPGESAASADYDEVYLTTRYASLDHWAATRDGAALGGNGPDYEALQAALAVRASLTLESRVTFLQGVVGPLPPVFMPATGENFVRKD